MEGLGCLRLSLGFHLLHHVGIEEIDYVTGNKWKVSRVQMGRKQITTVFQQSDTSFARPGGKVCSPKVYHSYLFKDQPPSVSLEESLLALDIHLLT